MSSELEQRLETMLTDAPEPEAGAGEEALHRALRALQPTAPAHRGLRTVVLAFAAAVVLLAIAAGSLSAAGALHVSFGTKKKPSPASGPSPTLRLPHGAAGVAAVLNGRLSVVTQSAPPLQGLPVTAAALSPHALYVAAGLGRSLVAIAPSGRKAFTHRVGGTVVAIAWAPDGFRIAYVVHAGGRFVLHVIYGNGIHDTTVDESVRPVRPSWRADSLAVAYVGGGGHAVVYDLGHTSHRVVGSTAPVAYLAYAPSGDSLAVGSLGGVSLVNGGHARNLGVHADIEAVGWQGTRLLVAQEMGVTEPLVRVFRQSGRQVGGFRVPGRVIRVTDGLVVTQTPNRILAGWRDKHVTTVLRPRPGTSVDDFAIG